MLEVIVSRRDAEPKTYRFDAAPIRIGRADDNDVVLEGEDCSRYHAEIVFAGGAYKVIDRDSRNGILRGGERLAEIPIDGTTIVEIAGFTLTIAPPDEAKPKGEIYLVYEDGGALRNIKIAPGAEYVIGRSPKADVLIQDPDCSKEHALVFSRGGEFRVKDLGSANGTMLDGRPIEEERLESGNRLLIGGTLITAQTVKAEVADEEALLERTQVRQRPAGLAPGTGAVAAAGSRRTLWVGILSAAIAVAALAVLAMRGVKGNRDGAPLPRAAQEAAVVRTTQAVAKELVFAVSATGSTKPRRTVTVSAEISGRIVEVPVEENRPVAEKSLLARVDDTDIKLKISEARSSIRADQLKLSRDDYERKQRLFDKGVVTRSVFEQSKNNYLTLSSTYDATQSRIRQLEEQLGKTRIAAPLAGIVVKKFATEGELVAVGAPVATIADLVQALVEAEVSDRDVVKIRTGQAVFATTDAYEGRRFEGTIDQISSLANPVTKTFRIEARLGNADLALKAGMIAYLRIVLEKARTTVIPAEALLADAGREAEVYVVVGGVAKRVKVQLGRRADRDVEVVEGIAEGDEVVVEGQGQLVDGRAVKLINPNAPNAR